MDRVCMGVATPEIRKEFGLDMITMGWIASAFNWAYASFQVPGGWMGTRSGTALGELFVIALVPSLAFAVLAPAVGEQFAVTEAIAYGLSAFAGASFFLGLAVLLSTLFNDVWRPLLLTCVGALVVAVVVPHDYGLFQAMGGRSYFFSGTLAWPVLIVSAAGAVGLIYAATARIARRDF